MYFDRWISLGACFFKTNFASDLLPMFASLRRRITRQSNADSTDAFRETDDKRHKSRRPPNTAFRQQRLKSWQPILTPRTVLPLLLLLAVICVPIGVAFIMTTYKVQKLEVNYSKCNSEASSSFATVPSKYVSSHFKSSGKPDVEWKYSSGKCELQFDVPNDISPPIYLYYKLTNYYQNHRKYVQSYDWNQLRGKAVALDKLTSNCKPLKERDNKIVYPCGLVANSMFNDTIGNPKSSAEGTYEFSNTGIAWSTDLKLYKRTEYNTSQIVPPENWAKKYPDGYTDDDLDSLVTDERFMNWMKTAALPSFYKKYGVNKSSTLKKGTYTMSITMNYPVTIFGGTKSVVISTSSVIGGRNMGLGICYVVLGGVAVLFMLAFLLKQIFGKKRSTHTFLDELSDPTAHGQRDVL